MLLCRKPMYVHMETKIKIKATLKLYNFNF